MYNEAVDKLVSEFSSMVKKIISQAEFDKSYTGRVVAVETIRSGLDTLLYTVAINGKELKIKSKLKYSVNDYVLVLIPRNNWNDAKLIYTG